MVWTDSLTRSKSGLQIDVQAVRELQNKVTLRFYLTLVRMASTGEKYYQMGWKYNLEVESTMPGALGLYPSMGKYTVKDAKSFT